MDFTFDEQQQAVVDLAHQIFTDALAPDLQTERLRVVEASDDWFDRDLWQVLADAGLGYRRRWGRPGCGSTGTTTPGSGGPRCTDATTSLVSGLPRG